MTVKERIILFIEYLKLSQSSFERYCGLSNGLVNNIGSSITARTREKISVKYPELNMTWLLMGEGEMLKTKNDEIVRKPIDQFVNIPIVMIRAMAGYLHGYGDSEYIESLPTTPVLVDKTYHGKYICFEVSGDSMDDGSRHSLCDRDIVLCREVKKDLWKYKLHLDNWYFVIVHKDGINIKKIVDHDTETGVITCHSLNPLYGDFTIKLSDVLELFSVIKIVDRSIRL